MTNPPSLADLDALDGEPFLARTTDGALKIGTAEVRGLTGHAQGSSPWLGLGFLGCPSS